MPKIYLDSNQDQDRSRLFVVAFLRYFLRICRLEQEAFQGDIETAIIARAVVIANIDSLMAEPKSRDKLRSVATAIDIAHQAGVTAMAISQATGFPRETVRRKLARLVQLGILARREDGKFVVPPPRRGDRKAHGTLAEIASESLGFLNACLDDGVFELKS